MSQKIHLPINLLLPIHGLCIVIGGGKIGTRKVLNLRRLGNKKIRLISPETTETILELVQQGEIEYLPRAFELGDLEGALLVFSTTGLAEVDNTVMNEAKRLGILFSRTDQAWESGDFLSPALVHSNEMLLGISTHGLSCRKSRHIKETLQSRINMLESITPFIIGIDHRLTSFNERENILILTQNESEMIEALRLLLPIHAFMLLKTCNRIEVIGIGALSASLIREVKRILGYTHVSEEKVYVHTGIDAVRHLAFTQSGLYAQTPLEKHISAQIKGALASAIKQGYGNKTLEEFGQIALHISRQIRACIEPHFKGIEFEEIIDHLTKEEKCSHVTVLGSGAMGAAVVKQLQKTIKINWVYRTKKPHLDHANVTCFPWEKRHEAIQASDMLITALKSEKPVVLPEDLAFLEKTAKVIDLGMPHNVEKTQLHQILDLDDLKFVYRKDHDALLHFFEHAEGIFKNEKNYYEKWLHSLDGGASCKLK